MSDAPDAPSFEIRLLDAADLTHMRALLGMFGEAFGELDTYTTAQPSDEYLAGLLGGECFIALAAVTGDAVIGGLAAYELKKFEQERSEIYVYDLAVAEPSRRQGVATALLGRLEEVAEQRGAWVYFLEADLGDEAAIAFYGRRGEREDVVHFDFEVGGHRR